MEFSDLIATSFIILAGVAVLLFVGFIASSNIDED